MSGSDDLPAKPMPAGEPGAGEIETARVLLAAIESRVFPGSRPVPLFTQATPVRQVVVKLFGDAG